MVATTEERAEGLAPFAARSAAAVAGLAALALVVVSPRYGWHRDELYFRVAGRHLDWGYVDQPPFAPLVARIADEVAGANLLALRLLPALTTAVTVLLGALLARELGGRRPAQVAAAVSVAGGGFVLGSGHLLSTSAFDLTAWMALLWLVARLLRTGDPRWWVAFGAVAGLSMLNKNLLVLLGVAIGAGLVVERRWDLLRSGWVAAGAALALVLAAPNLLWQASNGWPQLEMARVLADRLAAENRTLLLPLQVVLVGPFLVGVLVHGARWLRDDPLARAFRPLLWAWPAGLAAAFATAGRPYYVVPLTTVVVVAGVVAAERRADLRSLRPWLAAHVALGVLVALPVLPLAAVQVTGVVNDTHAESTGWPELADQVAEVVAGLPDGERASVVLLTATYGEAGALDLYGPARDLPPPHSPHNAYADFGRPADDRATVVAVRMPPEWLDPHFERCDLAARVAVPHDIDNEINGTPIHVCRGLRSTWAETWEELRFLS